MIIKQRSSGNSSLPQNPNQGVDYRYAELKDLWLAGGCFWGVQAYFDRIYGVAETTVGYANGKTPETSYYELAKTGHAETIHVRYDPEKVGIAALLWHFFQIIDPTSLNRQGGDFGAQYRTGIYYQDEQDLPEILTVVGEEQKNHSAPVVTEVLPLEHFVPAEEYHQDYLEKNPGGYCHVSFDTLRHSTPYRRPEQDKLKEILSPLQYKVTQENGTEPPFHNEYWSYDQKGIYVDIVTGEPLFVSSDKFDSGCGWPSFSRPIDRDMILEKRDQNFGMERIEVRSRTGDSHLGHVFNDGPPELGGMRYCINSAALRFIPLEEMEKRGYGRFTDLVK